MDAYASLLRMHEPATRRLALVVARSAAEADEATQDAFVKAWHALGRFRDGAAFRPWLLRIVVNEARNRRRSAGRRAGHELRFAQDRASGGTALPPEAAALAADRRRALAAALGQLPEPQRDVIACRYLVGLDEAETAAALRLPRGTVKSRAARGLTRLRALLPELGPESGSARVRRRTRCRGAEGVAMAESGDRRNDLAALAASLRDLGWQLELPATDPVADAVARIEALEGVRAEPSVATLARRRPRTRVLAAAAVAVALAVTIAAPGPREAVAGGLGLGRVAVTYTGDVPEAAARTYDLGTPVPLAQAIQGMEPPLAAPARLGDPGGSYVDRPAGTVTLAWARSPDLPEVADSGIGLLLTVLPGTTDAGHVSKAIGPGTTIELVRVDDHPAYWIAGEPHEVAVVDPAGRVVHDATRLAGNTLIWTDGDLTLRLESALDRAEAVDLATHLRPLRAG